ncbi:calcium-binding protein [Rhizobium sp.]
MKIVGSKGYDDSLFGGKGVDLIYGNGGNDLISAWTAIGDGAKDQIFAGAGDDLISGFGVNFSQLSRSASRGAKIDGGADYDMLIIDAVSKSKNTDLAKVHKVLDIDKVEEVIYNFSGATEKQKIVGTNANETIYIGEKGSTADGGKGNDYLFGGSGDDVLIGGAGNDFLSAAGGRNTLTGGKGADYFQFHLTEDYSYSNITDFKPGEDKIALVLDTGGEFSPKMFGDELRFIDRPMDAMEYLNYDQGRIMDKSLFSADADHFTFSVIYEQSTGSVLQQFRQDDGNGGVIVKEVLLAHLEGEPNLTMDDFVFFVL